MTKFNDESKKDWLIKNKPVYSVTFPAVQLLQKNELIPLMVRHRYNIYDSLMDNKKIYLKINNDEKIYRGVAYGVDLCSISSIPYSVILWHSGENSYQSAIKKLFGENINMANICCSFVFKIEDIF